MASLDAKMSGHTDAESIISRAVKLGMLSTSTLQKGHFQSRRTRLSVTTATPLRTLFGLIGTGPRGPLTTARGDYPVPPSVSAPSWNSEDFRIRQFAASAKVRQINLTRLPSLLPPTCSSHCWTATASTGSAKPYGWMATPVGSLPTGTVATTVLVAVAITETLFERALGT